jgi:hypothetical protein
MVTPCCVDAVLAGVHNTRKVIPLRATYRRLDIFGHFFPSATVCTAFLTLGTKRGNATPHGVISNVPFVMNSRPIQVIKGTMHYLTYKDNEATISHITLYIR